MFIRHIVLCESGVQKLRDTLKLGLQMEVSCHVELGTERCKQRVL